MGLRSWNRCIKGLDERDKISAQIISKYVEEKRVVAQVAKVWIQVDHALGLRIWVGCSLGITSQSGHVF